MKKKKSGMVYSTIYMYEYGKSVFRFSRFEALNCLSEGQFFRTPFYAPYFIFTERPMSLKSCSIFDQ